MSMKIVVDNQLVNYSDEGSGDVILLLHGWGANLQSFDEVAHRLQKNYRVIRIDFPGFGSSPQPAANWDIGDYATLVKEFLLKKEVIRLKAVIAHSFGGRIAIKLAGQNMLETEKIILIGSGGIRHSSSPRQQVYRIVAKIGKYVMKLPGLNKLQSKMRMRLYQNAGAMDYLESGDMKDIFLRVIDEDVRDFAAKIMVPTLLIWGEQDAETPLVDGKIFHDKIKHSTFIVIPAAGHFTYIDQPDLVMMEIEAFLR
jgi:pimeloyl-ACP methyl ester carboxylesterase